MKVLAVDPGSEQSAYLIWTGEKIIDMGILENDEVLRILTEITPYHYQEPNSLLYANMPMDIELVIEMPQCFGMAVGKSVFETIFWIGRFCQAWKWKFTRVYRSQIKMYFCNSMRAKDSNIRQAILDRFGGKEKAIGNKKSPGVLYGVKNHGWSALAVAVYFMEQGGK